MGNSPAVERLRRSKDYTNYERPLRWKDVAAYRPEFSRFVMQPFHVLIRLRSLHPALNRLWLRRLDKVLLKVFPTARHLAGGLVIYVEK
jgi:hypothetical protein